jgi:OFA family oxalate/formate antiporter-like MFS transporter
MTQPRVPERWIVLLAGVGIMMCIGTAYSWSLYTRPLMALFGWSNIQVSSAFAVMVFFIGVGAIGGGYLQDHFGPRNVGLIGVVMWGLGNALVGVGITRFGLPWLYACYGLIAGLGAGMAYLVPGATVTKWFPEERGLANGIILFGYGTGSIIFNGVLTGLPAFARMADRANSFIAGQLGGTITAARLVDPQGLDALRGAFVWPGIVFIIVGVVCSLVLHIPPRTFSVPKAAEKLAHEASFRPTEMLKTRSFYWLWTIFLVDAFAGLAILSNVVPIYSELTGANATVAGSVYGWLSIFNGLGRLVWAWISDFLGRSGSLAIIFLLEGASIALLGQLHSQLSVSLALTVMLLTFAGVFGIMPAMMADYFGTAYLGENYGLVISAVCVAGLLGPTLVGLLEDVSHTLSGALLPIAILLIVSSAIPIVARKPARPPATVSPN